MSKSTQKTITKINLGIIDAIHNAQSKERIIELIKQRADVNATCDNYVTPLHLACTYNEIEIAKILIENKADIHAKTHLQDTALHSACKSNNTNIDMVKLLIENKADIHAKNYFSNTALHLACRNAKMLVAQLLINTKSDVNAKGLYGDTPLHFACKKAHLEIVKLLLLYEVDINHKNESNKTVLEISKENKFIEIEMLLNIFSDVNNMLILKKPIYNSSLSKGNILRDYMLELLENKLNSKINEFYINTESNFSDLTDYKNNLLNISGNYIEIAGELLDKKYNALKKTNGIFLHLLCELEILGIDPNLDKQTRDRLFKKILDKHSLTNKQEPSLYSIINKLGEYSFDKLKSLFEAENQDSGTLCRVVHAIKTMQTTFQESGLKELFNDLPVINDISFSPSSDDDKSDDELGITGNTCNET